MPTEERRATCNLPCVINSYFPMQETFLTEHLRSSLVSYAITAVTASLTDQYLARATIAKVTKQSLRKIESRERHANCSYVNTLIARIGVSPIVPSLKEKSFLVVPRSVDTGGMNEIHIRYHRRHSNEIVLPRPITKARQMCFQTKASQMCVETKSRFYFTKRRLGLHSAIVEGNNCTNKNN